MTSGVSLGWLNAYREGGWLPSWASPGYRNCMVGTYADVTIADAIVKNIHGFDLNLAIEALDKDVGPSTCCI
jgi:putative alpha-1,2-mannosidase